MCRIPFGGKGGRGGKGKGEDDDDDDDEEEEWAELPVCSPKEIHAMQKIRDRELVQKLANEIYASLASYARSLKWVR